MFNKPKPSEIKNWVCVLQRNQEYEVEMAKNYLSNLKIPSNILSKRESAYGLNLSTMSPIYLYVPQEYEKKARQALAEWLDDESRQDTQD